MREIEREPARPPPGSRFSANCGKSWGVCLMGVQGRGSISNRRSADMEGGSGGGMFAAIGGNKGGERAQHPRPHTTKIVGDLFSFSVGYLDGK